MSMRPSIKATQKHQNDAWACSNSHGSTQFGEHAHAVPRVSSDTVVSTISTPTPVTKQITNRPFAGTPNTT